jgi:hypothetical protein
MRMKTLVCVLIFIVAVLACVGSFANDKEKYGFYVPKPNEEIYGTWVNKDYSGAVLGHHQKFVSHFWGYWGAYNQVTDKAPTWYGTFILVDKWKDSEGNIWYKEYDQNGWSKYGDFSLDKISKNGTIIESVYNSYMWPKEADLNPDNPNYRIYYRE